MQNKPLTPEERLDQALTDSFPASDPPFFVGAGAQPGPAPRKRRKPGDFGQDISAFDDLHSGRHGGSYGG
jgi:hypothetical protein